MKNIKLNKADKTLAAAGVIFLFSLYALTLFPENIFWQCLHFASEAALVGGIADWFAVTALFEKPCGFPYHTAILPRRRQEFTDAMVKLVKEQFFTNHKIIALLKDIHLEGYVFAWLEENSWKKIIQVKLHCCLQEKLSDEVCQNIIRRLADDIRAAITAISLADFFDGLHENIKDKNDTAFLQKLAAYLLLQADTPSTRQNILDFLAKYQEEKTQSYGLFASFLSGLASAMGVLDLDEATDIIHKHLLKLLENLTLPNSEESKVLRQGFWQEIMLVKNEPALQEFFEEKKAELAATLPLEEMLWNYFQEIKKATPLLASPGEKALTVFKEAGNPLLIIESSLMVCFAQIPEIMCSDKQLKEQLANLLDDVTARCLLYGREISEQVIRFVLAGLSDEQLNKLVYEKVEPDMLWIRMNGSIVGSLVGVILFSIFKMTEAILP